MGSDLFQEAVERLGALVDDARSRGISEPSTASLATAGRDGRPTVRTVSIRTIDATGLFFFLNGESGKGRQLAENPRAALCFFWRDLRQQVTLEGQTERLDEVTSDEHWARQPREYQLAAWTYVYEGSNLMPDRRDLREAVRSARRDFHWESVSRPPEWFGIQLHPDVIQFWRPNWRRLDYRVRYARNEAGIWTKERINPL